MSWLHEVSIKDICDLITVKTNIKNASIENYISTENMLPNFGGVEYAEKIPLSNTVNTFIPQDVLFSNIRTYFKKVWFSKFNGTVSADVLVFRARENCDSKFLYYLLCDPSFTEYTVLTSKGAKMPRGDKDAIFSYPVLLPSLKEQKAIASLLSSLDEKIDLLHRQNKTLESMSETLFRQYFIEEAQEDWEDCNITDLFEIRDGTHASPKQSLSGYPLVTSKHIGSGIIDFNNTYLISEEDYSSINKRSKVEKFDILFSMIGTLGSTHIELSDEINYAIKNVGLLKTSQNHDWKIYTYLWLLSSEGKDFIHATKSGSTQEYISLGSLRSIVFNKPDNNTLRKFNKIAEIHFDKIHENNKQIRTLEKLRNTLLPKLMSGEVRVEYAEKAIASVA